MTTPFDALREALADRYAIEAELGRGGMATVYRAADLRHRRTVAIKVLQPEFALAVPAARFLREIEIAAALSHPHILPVFDSGAVGGVLYYVMPLAENESLRARLERERQLPLEDALHITREVADALAYAHSRNVLHRDIKPENILLHEGHALVADFGIARAIAVARDDRLTGSGAVMGTPAYMSPEQASGETQLDARSDIYSLACVVYEMLGGEPPHTGPTPQAILARQLTGEVRSLTPLRSSVTAPLDMAIRRALARAPADRFATAFEFATAVSRAAAGEPARPAPTRGRPRGRIARVAAAAAAVAVAGWVVAQALPAGSGDRRLSVAVFPFRAAAAADQWVEALPDLLATTLDGTPDVRVADPWSLWRELRASRDQPAQSPDPIEAARLAERAGAARFVLGAVTQNGPRLDLTLRVYQTGRADPVRTVAIAGSSDSLPGLVQRAAVAVLEVLGASGLAGTRGETYATHSADAVKAYLVAREAMRRGLVDSADAAIDRALGLDSNFALALVSAAGIKSWQQFSTGQPYRGLVPLAERAVRVSDSLGERERLRARAMLASLQTDGRTVAEALGRLLEIDSTDLQALDLLGHSHLVYGWQYGRGEVEARDLADQALRYDPGHVPALGRRAYLAAFAEDTADIRRQIALLRRADTTNGLVRGAILSLRTLDASDAVFESLLDTIVAAPVPEWFSALRSLRSYDPPRAERLLTRLRASVGPGFPLRAAVGGSVQLALAEGRLREMDSTGRAGAFKAFPGLQEQVHLFVVASAISGVSDSAVTHRALDALTAFVPVDSAAAYINTRPVWWAGWALGAYHAMFGDSAVTARWRAALATLPPGGTSRDYRGALQADFDSRLAARRGDLRRALMLAERAYDLWTIHANNTFESQPEPAMRFHIGVLLRATGRPDSAVALFRSLVPPTTWMGFYTARASLELAEVAEQRGDRAGAARHYAMALALWVRGGPEVAAWRERAASGLRRAVVERAE